MSDSADNTELKIHIVSDADPKGFQQTAEASKTLDGAKDQNVAQSTLKIPPKPPRKTPFQNMNFTRSCLILATYQLLALVGH